MCIDDNDWSDICGMQNFSTLCVKYTIIPPGTTCNAGGGCNRVAGPFASFFYIRNNLNWNLYFCGYDGVEGYIGPLILSKILQPNKQEFTIIFEYCASGGSITYMDAPCNSSQKKTSFVAQLWCPYANPNNYGAFFVGNFYDFVASYNNFAACASNLGDESQSATCRGCNGDPYNGTNSTQDNTGNICVGDGEGKGGHPLCGSFVFNMSDARKNNNLSICVSIANRVVPTLVGYEGEDEDGVICMHLNGDVGCLPQFSISCRADNTPAGIDIDVLDHTMITAEMPPYSFWWSIIDIDANISITSSGKKNLDVSATNELFYASVYALDISCNSGSESWLLNANSENCTNAANENPLSGTNVLYTIYKTPLPRRMDMWDINDAGKTPPDSLWSICKTFIALNAYIFAESNAHPDILPGVVRRQTLMSARDWSVGNVMGNLTFNTTFQNKTDYINFYQAFNFVETDDYDSVIDIWSPQAGNYPQALPTLYYEGEENFFNINSYFPGGVWTVRFNAGPLVSIERELFSRCGATKLVSFKSNITAQERASMNAALQQTLQKIDNGWYFSETQLNYIKAQVGAINATTKEDFLFKYNEWSEQCSTSLASNVFGNTKSCLYIPHIYNLTSLDLDTVPLYIDMLTHPDNLALPLVPYKAIQNNTELLVPYDPNHVQLENVIPKLEAVRTVDLWLKWEQHL